MVQFASYQSFVGDDGFQMPGAPIKPQSRPRDKSERIGREPWKGRDQVILGHIMIDGQGRLDDIVVG